jgi:translation initiation factor IF-2
MPRKSTAKTTPSQTTENKNTPATAKHQTGVRPPIVAILGHVDHGKTSLLDKIRQTNLQAKEAGGITQSIGAYQIDHKGKKITFIDTPGHEAFTAMRARGGGAADIVVLVIAANEGIKPQTVESIGHAKAANVPMIIAFNKIDLPTANTQKIKQELLKHEIITEDLGGDVVAVDVSATAGTGIDQLLEMIGLVAEMQELTTELQQPAQGIVLEARQDARKGILATLLLKQGILKPGAWIATPTVWGKVKRMTDWQGAVVQEVHPGTPVEVLGLQQVPQAGQEFAEVESEKVARSGIPPAQKPTATVPNRLQEQEIKIVPLVVKADTQGALEAFLAALEGLNTDEGRVNIVHAGLGDINEADVMLATVSRAIILGFNVEQDKAAVNASQIEKVPVMTYDIIYRALEDVGDFLESEADQLRAIGEAEILQVFELSDGTLVAGSRVTEGHITKGSKVQVIRGEDIIAEARISSIRQGKEQKSKINEGEECGIILSTQVAFQPGDTFLIFPL